MLKYQLSKTHLFTYLTVCLILFSCCSKRITKQSQLNANTLKTICPNNGTCSFDIQKKKNLNLVFDNLGALNPEIKSGDNVVLKFQYKRNEVPNAVDGHYRELVYLELNPDKVPLTLENKYLQNVKLIFGLFCYCKGQAGYYKITNGNLAIKKVSDSKYQLKLRFKTDAVPQVITEINETFTL